MTEPVKRPRGRPRKNPAPITKPPKPSPPPATGIPVTIHFPVRYAAFGDPQIKSAVPVDWPRDWPFPVPGSRVVVGDKTGFVEFLTFDPTTRKLSIHTR